MHRDLPPFAALRAFEAAARHGSFKNAAEELCLTQSAVSHRIKELEDFLGTPLFHRLTRKIVLTEVGGGYLAELTGILDRIECATANVRDRDVGGKLAMRGTPTFVNRWLLPHLNVFTAAYPGIELHISTSLDPAEFDREDIDLAVEWNVNARSGVIAEPFFETASFPVVSPTLLDRCGKLEVPDDLRRVVLLHNHVGDTWPEWLSAAGATIVNAAAGPRFAHCDLAIQAAIDGQGVALAFAELARFDIEAGRLLRLFDIELPGRAIYSIARPAARAMRPRIAAMRDWLFAEARCGSLPHSSLRRDNGLFEHSQLVR